MSGEISVRNMSRWARVIHLGQVIGLVLFASLFVLLMPYAPMGLDRSVGQLLTLGVLIVPTALLFPLYRRIPGRGPDEDLETWWRDQVVKCLPIWVLLTSGGMLAAIIAWFTKAPLGFRRLVAGGGPALMVILQIWFRPSRFESTHPHRRRID